MVTKQKFLVLISSFSINQQTIHWKCYTDIMDEHNIVLKWEPLLWLRAKIKIVNIWCIMNWSVLFIKYKLKIVKKNEVCS